jgi:hypothetical protein
MLRYFAVATLACAGFLSADPVHAAYLYWTKVQVSSSEESSCYSFARTVARDALTNVRFTPGVEVAGSQGGSYAAITCVGRGSNSRAIAVIMVMGDDQGAAVRTRDDLAGRIQRVRRLD